MINRQTIYSALFKLKNAGINIDDQIKIMTINSGIPPAVIKFLQDNSPQFQFYHYIQKYQRALSNAILDYKDLNYDDKIITASSFITRVYLAVKYKNLDRSLIDDLNIQEIPMALNDAIFLGNTQKLDEIMMNHQESLKLFYKNLKTQ